MRHRQPTPSAAERLRERAYETAAALRDGADGLAARAREQADRARKQAARAWARARPLAHQSRPAGKAIAGLAAAVLALGTAGAVTEYVTGGTSASADPAMVSAGWASADAVARAEAAERASRADRPAARSEPASEPPADEPASEPPAAEPAEAADEPAPAGGLMPVVSVRVAVPGLAALAPLAAPEAPSEPQPDPEPQPPPWVAPMPSARVTSCFGPRWGALHKGIDFAAAAGTEILAAGAGTVIGAGWLYSGYGISVVIDHGDGHYSHYAHAAKVLVKAGQKVEPGQPIALEGSTGNSTGPHLHFEIHKGMWSQVNPAPWLRARGVNVPC